MTIHTIHTFPAKPRPFEKLVTYRPAPVLQYAADVAAAFNGYRLTCGSYSIPFVSLTNAGRMAQEINEAVAEICARWEQPEGVA